MQKFFEVIDVKQFFISYPKPHKAVSNLSLEEGKFPSEWKGALVKPKLKKADLDLIKENFRPLTNLQLFSKLTEKAVA